MGAALLQTKVPPGKIDLQRKAKLDVLKSRLFCQLLYSILQCLLISSCTVKFDTTHITQRREKECVQDTHGWLVAEGKMGLKTLSLYRDKEDKFEY